MNYILRTFFHAFGLAVLFVAFALNPATAQFKDLLMMLHTGIFWNVVCIAFISIVGADLVLSGNANKGIEVMINIIERLREARSSKTSR